MVAAFIFVVSLITGGYYLKRWWNWSWAYEDQSIELIQEMVKPECLIGDKDNGN